MPSSASMGRKSAASQMTSGTHPDGFYWYFPVRDEPEWNRHSDYAPAIVYLEWWPRPARGSAGPLPALAGGVFLPRQEYTRPLLALQGQFVGPLAPPTTGADADASTPP